MEGIACVCPDNEPKKRRLKPLKIKMDKADVLSMWLLTISDIVFRVFWFSVTVLIVGFILHIAIKFYKADYYIPAQYQGTGRKSMPRTNWENVLHLGPYLREHQVVDTDNSEFYTPDLIEVHERADMDGNRYSTIIKTGRHKMGNHKMDNLFTILTSKSTRDPWSHLGSDSRKKVVDTSEPTTKYISKSTRTFKYSTELFGSALFHDSLREMMTNSHNHATKKELLSADDATKTIPRKNKNSKTRYDIISKPKKAHHGYQGLKNKTRIKLSALETETDIYGGHPSEYHPAMDEMYPDITYTIPTHAHPEKQPSQSPNAGSTMPGPNPQNTYRLEPGFLLTQYISEPSLLNQDHQNQPGQRGYPSLKGYLVTISYPEKAYLTKVSHPEKVYLASVSHPEKGYQASVSYPERSRRPPRPTYIPAIPIVMTPSRTADTYYQSQLSQQGNPGQKGYLDSIFHAKKGYLAKMSHPEKAYLASMSHPEKGYQVSMSHPERSRRPPRPTYIPGFPILMTSSRTADTSAVEWIPSSPQHAHTLADKAIVAGYEANHSSPLWIIRTKIEGDLVPGKLAIKNNVAFVPWGGKENVVQNFEVCCARPDRIRWVESRDGVIPPKAISAGYTSSREPLYIGRAKYQGSLTPGKVHPSHKQLYIPFGGQEIPFKLFEVLCSV